MDKIDFVITWVDGSDIQWQKEKNKYSKEHMSEESKGTVRYRDWDNLKYWFRGVEKYAPWVNKVFLVTCGQKPKWLNTDCPKLVCVKHEDYIPSQYLPTFSSHPIELNLHRIANLSERFVYFNDDCFITKPIFKKDFFKKGLPVDSIIENVIQPSVSSIFDTILFNNIALFNRNFDKRNVIRTNALKWFSIKYGKGILNNIYMLPFKCISSFRYNHNAQPFLKSTFSEVWEKEGDYLDKVCQNKFRSREDVNQYIFRYWQFGKGTFEPGMRSSYSVLIRKDNQEFLDLIYKQKYKLLCLNDVDNSIDFEKCKIEINRAFEYILPEKSSFEE